MGQYISKACAVYAWLNQVLARKECVHLSTSTEDSKHVCGGGGLLRSLLKPFFNADMQIDVVEYGPGWERLGGTSFLMSHCFFNPHDFAITPNHHVFFQVSSASLAGDPRSVRRSCAALWRSQRHADTSSADLRRITDVVSAAG